MTRPDLHLLLFDLGSTLIYARNPWPPILARAEAALQNALIAAGIRMSAEMYQGKASFLNFYNQYRDSRQDLTEVLSSTLLKELLIKNGCNSVSNETILIALRAMYTVTQSNWYPDEDALSTLQTLKSQAYSLGLISNAADDENTQQLIDNGGFRPYFDFIVSSAAFGIRKPDPRIFQLALAHFGVNAEQTAMIGDTLDADILGANQLGMYSIWITRYTTSNIEEFRRIEPSATLRSLSEIPAHLAGLR
jgi:HAD superfamily hydrolase (TIGR01509 family)